MGARQPASPPACLLSLADRKHVVSFACFRPFIDPPACLFHLFTPPGLPSPAPHTHPALPCPAVLCPAGHLNLIYTHKSSRRKGLELLTSSEKGQHMHLVEQHRVVALALEPVSSGRETRNVI